MGDPKFSRQQYEEPTHPWMGDRIEREDEYVRKYGLKNKKEFWKAESMLRQQRAQARQYLPLVLRDVEQGKKEANQLLDKLDRLGVLSSDASLDDVLALDVDAILSRRLQTLTFLKGLANTPNQARQFIVHGHIAIDGQTVDVPGYLVESDEEATISYSPGSPLRNEAHPLHQGVDRPDDIGVGDTPDVEGPGAGPEEPEAEEADEAEEAEAEEAEVEDTEADTDEEEDSE
ncbi:30S ribosomal protein S4 [Thermoplasmatales archaeon SW_10_69_26]|nr:MAG: 30S ribosomal protein S4 [Thermoplasmatales archaeon SW_10_69_26]